MVPEFGPRYRALFQDIILSLFSSPEPLAHDALFDRWMSVVRRAMYVVVRRQQLLQRTSPPKLLVVFDQMVLDNRSHRLKIDFQDENFKNLFSETTMPRALIFSV